MPALVHRASHQLRGRSSIDHSNAFVATGSANTISRVSRTVRPRERMGFAINKTFPLPVVRPQHSIPKCGTSVSTDHFRITRILRVSLPGLTGQSSTHGRCLLDRPVEPGDDSEVCVAT